MHALRLEAEALRAQGYSYSLISEKLGISKSTMSYWFKDKPYQPNEEVLKRIKHGTIKHGIERHNKRVAEIAELKALGITEIGTLSQRDLWLLGIGLFIGAGSKTTEAIRIVNSDPSTVKLAIRWLRECCNLGTENLTISLHIYSNNDPEACKDYWQFITGLPRENFRWISVDKRNNKQISNKGKLPFGTAHITVRSNGDPDKGVRLFRKIMGWIDGVYNQV